MLLPKSGYNKLFLFFNIYTYIYILNYDIETRKTMTYACTYIIHHKGIPQCTTRILLSLYGLRIITSENAVRFNRLEFHTNKKKPLDYSWPCVFLYEIPTYIMWVNCGISLKCFIVSAICMSASHSPIIIMWMLPGKYLTTYVPT